MVDRRSEFSEILVSLMRKLRNRDRTRGRVLWKHLIRLDFKLARRTNKHGKT
jgi:hypothetical protein